jgi:hypothetical protein
MACRQTGESEGARRQWHGFAVGKFCPSIGGVDVIGKPGENVVAELGFDSLASAGSGGFEGSLVADED